MNNDEALTILQPVLARYRALSYQELRSLIAAGTSHIEIVAPSGITYQVDIRVYWDAGPDGDIRVIANVDDGGWRAVLPLGDSFIKAPDGSCVDE